MILIIFVIYEAVINHRGDVGCQTYGTAKLWPHTGTALLSSSGQQLFT